MPTVRNATKEDIPLIRKLTFEIWPGTYTPILGPEQVAYMLDTMYNTQALEHQMDSGQQYLLCYNDGAAVAFASYSPHGMATHKLNKIYVLPEMSGRGVGAFMIDHIVAAIRAEGSGALELNVNIYNKAAREFYERLRFVVYKEEDIDIGQGYFMNDFVMRLEL